jgi:hypothetical protein
MPRWLPIGGRLTFSFIFSNPRVVSHPASHFCWWGRARAKWKSQQPTLADRTQHVRNCAESNMYMKGLEQDVEGPCDR